MKKQILHIDFDSFFASVEQQANPFLRNKPIGVVGSKTNKGVICAASVQAKRLGIKTGMPVFKAREMKKDIQLVKVDFTKYNYIHEKSLKMFNSYSPNVEVFSIDEVFMDITKNRVKDKSPKQIAQEVQKHIQKEFGEFITCSIGIAENKLLAKLASDINKPNGIFEIDENNMKQVLQNTKLQDFCGIGPQTFKKLEQMGITNLAELKQTSLTDLYRSFGQVKGSFLKNLSEGKDESLVSAARPKPKSISHQQTQITPIKNDAELKIKVMKLTEQLVTKLRDEKMVCKKVYVGVRSKNKTMHVQKETYYKYTNSRQDIYNLILEALQKLPKLPEYTFIDVGLNDLIQEQHRSKSLFEEGQEIDKLIDKVNKKWGDFTLQKRPMF